MGEEEARALVVDSGSSAVRAGFAGDDFLKELDACLMSSLCSDCPGMGDRLHVCTLGAECAEMHDPFTSIRFM